MLIFVPETAHLSHEHRMGAWEKVTECAPGLGEKEVALWVLAVTSQEIFHLLPGSAVWICLWLAWWRMYCVSHRKELPYCLLPLVSWVCAVLVPRAESGNGSQKNWEWDERCLFSWVTVYPYQFHLRPCRRLLASLRRVVTCVFVLEMDAQGCTGKQAMGMLWA